MDLAVRRATPYVSLGQGLGPLRGPGVGPAVRRYLERARAVVLRDPASVALARRLGVAPEKITEAGDLALLLEPARAATAENLLRSVGRGEVESGGGEPH